MRMRNYTYIAGIIIIALMLVIGIKPISCNAAIVWSDDFNDGDYSGWTVHSGAFAAENYMLESLESTVDPPEEGWINIISHESSVVVGTWSFDILCRENFIVQGFTERVFEIQFIAPSTDFLNHSCYSFGVWQSMTGALLASFTLTKWVDGVRDTDKTKSFPNSNFNGWTHIDITRNTTGHMDVYINETLRLSTQDTELDTSNYFIIGAISNLWLVAVDNITVNDVPLTTTTSTPTPTPTPTSSPTTTDTSPPPGISPELLAIGIGVPVILVIVLVVWKVRK